MLRSNLMGSQCLYELRHCRKVYHVQADYLAGRPAGDVLVEQVEHVEVANCLQDLLQRSSGSRPVSESADHCGEGELHVSIPWRRGTRSRPSSSFTWRMPSQWSNSDSSSLGILMVSLSIYESTSISYCAIRLSSISSSSDRLSIRSQAPLAMPPPANGSELRGDVDVVQRLPSGHS